MVRALVPGIVLRAEPTIAAYQIGILPEGSRSFVVGGPWEADGYEWIALSGTCLPLTVGCSTFPSPELCPVWQGYVATGASASEPWFALDPTDCPSPESDPQAFMLLGDIEALHCFGTREIEFTAWITTATEPEPCPFEPHPALWLACAGNSPAVARARPDDGVGLELFVDPDSSIRFTRSGYWATIAGRLDHPISQQCNMAVGVNLPFFGAAAILECRAHFVVTRHEAAAP
jgi:hypothetical protein